MENGIKISIPVCNKLIDIDLDEFINWLKNRGSGTTYSIIGLLNDMRIYAEEFKNN